jgi:hypothetical protein
MEGVKIPRKRRAERRAELAKRKARAKARRVDMARYLWRHGEDGELVWYRDIPDARTVGILARTPRACTCGVCKRPRYNRTVANREWGVA